MATLLEACKGVFFYLDDVIVLGDSKEEHLERLRHVLQRIADPGLKLNNKCFFDVAELSFLCHHVNGEEIVPLKQKVDVINAASTPTDPFIP